MLTIEFNNLPMSFSVINFEILTSTLPQKKKHIYIYIRQLSRGGYWVLFQKLKDMKNGKGEGDVVTLWNSKTLSTSTDGKQQSL